MMEGSNKRKLILLKGFIFCLFICCFRSTCAQEGFVSIQCCADTKYTDPDTNISYKGDNDWYPNRSVCQKIPSHTTFEKARFFNSVYGNKWCYTLATAKNQDYLIRGTFPCQDQSSQGSFSFDVFIGVTQLGTVNSSNDTIVEGFFTATDDYVDFCLEKQYGDPYISRLELRPLSVSSYLNTGNASNILKLIERVDAGSDGSHIRYIRILFQFVYFSNGYCKSHQSSHPAKQIVIGAVVSALILAIIAVGVYFACIRKRKAIPEEKFMIKRLSLPKNVIFSLPSIDEVMVKSISVQNFTLACIEDATQKYQTLIGEGGFGSVYRGTLSDGQEVAVKVLSSTSTQGTREFENELNLLSTIQHENLIPLLGYCCENEQQMLVYPFMSNGSLQDRLYGEAAKRKVLDWPTRLSIALGAARGLTYLHTFSGRAIIHRDVKSSNILLDHSMCAKVADFGFSKYAPQEGDSGASLEVRGTAGYLDPEYYQTQQLSAKSDVFSFGVVLLEIVSGREPLNIHRPRNEWSLVEWAKPYIRLSKIDEIVDPTIKGGYHAEAMWRVVEVALTCIEPFSAYRPCMIDIVRELEDALIIENNASEYMKSIDSFNASNRFSIERTLVIPPTPALAEASPILCQPPPPQPR